MTKQRIQIGIENSGTGDTLRAAMIKINNNFDELYDLQGQDSTGKAIDISGNTISSTFTNTDITISPNGTGNVVIDGDLVTNIIKSDDSTGVIIDDNLVLTGTIKADSSSLIRISENVDIDGTVTATSFTGDGSGLTNVTATIDPLNIVADDSTDMEITVGTDRLFFQGGTNITTSTDSGAQLTISVDDAPTFSGNVTLGGDIVTSGNDDITLEPGGTGDILLKTGGQVGIGSVSSPDTSLHIKTAGAKITVQRTADANTPGLSFQNSGGNVRAELQMDGTSGTSNEIFVKTHDGSSLSERFRVKHTGAQVTGDLQVTGNFTVSGTTTSVNTTNLEIQDALLELSKNNSGGADVDAGLLIQRGSAGNNAAFYWNEGDDKFKAVLTTSAADASAVTDSSTATIVANLEGTASVATTVTVTDNESTNEENVVTFVAGADSDGGNVGLESDGNFTYNPSTGAVTATKFKGDGSELTGISGGGSSTLNVVGDDSTDMEIALGSDRLFFQGGTNVSTSTDSGAQLTISVADAPTFSGAVTAAGFTIGSAAINEAELETIDGVTAGTVAASKAVVVDSNKDIGSFRNVTATGSFIIGSADMNETDLEKLDGITNGTVAASKAVVVDSNKDAGTFRNITASGTVQFGSLSDGTITATAFVDEDDMSSNSATLIPTQQSVKAYVDTEISGVSGGSSTLNVIGDDSTDMEIALGTDRLFFQGGTNISTSTDSGAQLTISVADAPTFSGAVTAAGFTIGSAAINESELETIDGVTAGTVAASKAVVVDSNKDIGDFRNVTASGSFIIGSADMNETDLEKLDGITNGTAAANKAVVLDGSKDIGTLGAVTATSFVIGSADINETDLEKIDGITNGTVAANKAVVVDGSKDAGSFRNITATGTITTAVLDVNSIESTDSTAVRINEGLDVVGTLQTHTIEPLDSTQVQINDIRTQTITANDSTAVRIEDGLDVRGALNVNSLEIGNGPIIVAVLDEDNFASDSATALATQQSIKAYVGSQTGSSISFRIAGSSDSTQASVDLSSNEEFRLVGGNSVTTTIANTSVNTMTVALDDNIAVDEISAKDSSNIQIKSPIAADSTISSGAITSSGVVTATGFTIGSAAINETELETIDGITAGTVAASKAVVVDSNKDIGSFRNITATGATTSGTFVIGDADINEADLEQIDGLTAGTVAASKAVVVDSNKDIGDFRNVTATGTVTTAILDVNSIKSTDSSNIRIDEGLDVVGGLFVSEINAIDSSAIEVNEVTNFNANVVVKADVEATGSFIIGSASMNETDLEKLDGITNGTVAANKAVVVDGNKDAGSFRNITATGATTSGTFVIGSADINEADLEQIDGLTAGTVAASKAVVVDSNKDIGDFRNFTASGNGEFGGNLQVGGNLTVSGTTTSVNTTNLEIQDALLELNKNNSGGADVDAGIFVQRGSAGNNAVLYWNEGDDSFKAVLSNSAADATSVTDSSFAALEVGSLTVNAGVGITASSGDVTVANSTSNKDLIFTVNDGGSATEVFRLDGDVSALLVASGKELQFADSGEKISGDGTDLTIASGAKINLNATSDIHIPNDVGIVFGGASEKIEGDGTDLVISANNLTVDAAADIILDAGGNDFNFKAGGTEILRITNSSSDVIIRPVVDAKDLIFQQRDGTEVARIEDNGTFNVVTDKLAINGTAVTSTAAELNFVDGSTAGTVVASKAVVVDSNKDIGDFRNVTASGTVKTALLDVNSIFSTDSSNIRINEGLDVVGGLFVSEINAIDSSAIEVNEVTNFNANVVVKADVEATGSFIIGDASMNEADLEQLDGLTAGTVTASKAVVVDSDKDITGFRNVTATKFIIGSADIDETDLEKIDGITNGAGAANKALVLDGSADVASGLRNLTASGTVKAATLDINSIISTDSSNIRVDEGLDVVGGLFVSEINAIDSSAIEVNEVTNFNANVVVKADVTATGSFIIGSASMNETDLEKLDGITDGTVAANKAVVVDSNKDAGDFRNLTASTLTADGGVSIDNITIDGTEIDLSSGDLTLDVAGDIVLDAGGDEVIFKDGSTNVGHVSLDSDNLTIKSLVSDKDLILQGNDGGSGITALTLDMSEAGAATFNDTVTATGFIIGSADINEADLEQIDGLTAGTVAASKAVVVDSNKDAGDFRNVTLSGTLHTTTLDVREILSTDSTNITVNEGLEVLGTIQVNEITSSDSSEVTINNIRTQVITANDSTEVLINDALRVSGLITGTATAAQYSDLAERYEADAPMEKGDVVEIGGSKEITKVNEEVSDTIFGVVSSIDQAGFTMNTEAGNDATHPLVALTGRVVVKVEGPVTKGDRLVTSATAGVARQALKSECNAFTVVGRALEDKSTDGIGLVLCYVQSHA